jgi:hypothetical protein
MKKYFIKGGEFCAPISTWKAHMKAERIAELTLYEAKPERIEDAIWCNAVGACGDRGNCGKVCDMYEPRNGKSGACRRLGRFYEPTDKTVTLKITL